MRRWKNKHENLQKYKIYTYDDVNLWARKNLEFVTSALNFLTATWDYVVSAIVALGVYTLLSALSHPAQRSDYGGMYTQGGSMPRSTSASLKILWNKGRRDLAILVVQCEEQRYFHVQCADTESEEFWGMLAGLEAIFSPSGRARLAAAMRFPHKFIRRENEYW